MSVARGATGRRLLPHLIIALGIVVGTALAASLDESRLLVLSGPAVLLAAGLAAVRLRGPARDARSARIAARVAVGGIMGVGVILAWVDPEALVLSMPVLGASLLPMLLADEGRGCRASPRSAGR